MFTKFSLPPVLVLCVVLLLSTAMVETGVNAREQPFSVLVADPPPVPGGPGFISIMGGTCTPTDDTIRWNVNAGELSNPDPDNLGSYMAPVMLPHGAIVKQLVVFYNDLRADDLTVSLRRKTTDQFFQDLATVTSQGAGGYGYSVNNEINAFFKTVDNQSYSYALSVTIPKKIGTTYNDLYLVSVRIDFDYPVYLPTVQK